VDDKVLLLDACVLLNLLATGRLKEVVESLDKRFVIVAEVAAETYYLVDDRHGGTRQAKFVLHDIIGANLLTVPELSSAEISVFVSLAGSLCDDGEAATMAVAHCRGIPWATDDRKARRVGEAFGTPAASSTAELLKAFATKRALAAEQIREMLAAVQVRARYCPRVSYPCADWWHEQLPDQ